VVGVTSPALTLTAAIRRTRRPAQEIEVALRSGALRSLAPRDLDAWRRAYVAEIVTPRVSA
jgi:hypothetical protein